MNTFIQQLIIHHFNKTASKEDEERLEKWLQESEENRAEFETMKTTWQETKAFFEVNDSEEKTDSNGEYLEEEGSIVLPPLPNYYPKRDLYKDLFKMSVGIVLLIVIVWTIKLFIQPSKTIVPTQKIQTFQDDQREVSLEDGTKVWLNQNTILTIPRKFSEDERQVRLFGEAFFEVTKDKNRPFIVLNKNTEINVLGTSFNVQVNKERVRVAVKEGKVRLTSRIDSTQSITLEKNERGIFNMEAKVLEKAILQKEKDWNWQSEFLQQQE